MTHHRNAVWHLAMEMKKSIRSLRLFLCRCGGEKTIEVLQSDHLMLRKKTLQFLPIIDKKYLGQTSPRVHSVCIKQTYLYVLVFVLYKNVKYITFCDISLHSNFAFFQLCLNDSQIFPEGNFITKGMKIKFY